MPPARRRQCGTMQAYEELAETSPAFRDNQARIHEVTRRGIETGRGAEDGQEADHDPGRRPRVYKRQAQNISNTQIKSQIDRLRAASVRPPQLAVAGATRVSVTQREIVRLEHQRADPTMHGWIWFPKSVLGIEAPRGSPGVPAG